jgi:cytochrome c biogenesis protein CcdA
MTNTRVLKLAYFTIGIGLPFMVASFWSKRSTVSRKQEIDRAHDITVEDGFPASDPPSA